MNSPDSKFPIPIRFGTDGWRGVISDDFTFANLRLVAQAVADHFTEQGQAEQGLAVGFDTRFLSDRYAIEVSRVLAANGIRADRVDRDLLARMKEVGVREVGFGADGGNNRVLLDIVHKGETIESIEQAIQDAIDVGLEVRLFIVVGHPGETMSDIEDSFALAQRYSIILLHLNNPIPYPGTELFEWVRSEDCFLVPPEEYLNNLTDSDNEPIFETPELPADLRRQLLKRARQIERSVWRRATERMFEDLPVIRTIAGWLLASQFGRWLFYKNKFARSVVDRILYQKMMRD